MCVYVQLSNKIEIKVKLVRCVCVYHVEMNKGFGSNDFVFIGFESVAHYSETINLYTKHQQSLTHNNICFDPLVFFLVFVFIAFLWLNVYYP